VADFFQKDPGFTGHEFFVTHLARRLGQRLAVGGDPSTLESAARVWEGIRDKAARERFVGGVIQSLEGVVPGGISDSFAQVLQHQIQAENGGPVTAALRNSAPGALAPALRLLSDPKAPANDRLAVAHVLAERDHPESVPALLSILSSANAPSRLRRAALLAAARHPDAAVPRAVLSGYESRIAGDPQLRVTALRVLAGRAEWAALLIDAVNEWKIPVPHMVPEVVHLLSQHRAQSPAIAAALEQHWKGMFGALSPGDRLIESKRLRESLREASGSAEAGKPLFQQLCGACHKLFGEGRDIGPELTGYERANADFWIDNLVYPSLEIREGFGSYTATTRTGQTFTGILESQSASGVVLRDLSGEKTRLRSVDLASLEASPFSLMPEGLLRGLNAGQVRDLFAYLMRPARDAESRR
jgi:putative heme-binding domain-containing protein